MILTSMRKKFVMGMLTALLIGEVMLMTKIGTIVQKKRVGDRKHFHTEHFFRHASFKNQFLNVILHKDDCKTVQMPMCT